MDLDLIRREGDQALAEKQQAETLDVWKTVDGYAVVIRSKTGELVEHMMTRKQAYQLYEDILFCNHEYPKHYDFNERIESKKTTA